MSRLDVLRERATGPLVDLPASTVVAVTAGDLRGLFAVAEAARLLDAAEGANDIEAAAKATEALGDALAGLDKA